MLLVVGCAVMSGDQRQKALDVAVRPPSILTERNSGKIPFKFLISPITILIRYLDA
jgi:hypothetical protein